jgi:hypothetical protein
MMDRTIRRFVYPCVYPGTVHSTRIYAHRVAAPQAEGQCELHSVDARSGTWSMSGARPVGSTEARKKRLAISC